MQTPIFWLKRAYLATRKALDEELAPYGLTAAQYDVLMMLWKNDGQEQRAIQECLGISAATLTGLVDALVNSGFIERRIHLDDARVKRLYLSQTGRDLEHESTTVGQPFKQRFLDGFSPTEAALLGDWLQRLAQNMGDVSKDNCG